MAIFVEIRYEKIIVNYMLEHSLNILIRISFMMHVWILYS